MGIPSTTQPSQPPKGKEKRYERRKEKVNYEIKDDQDVAIFSKFY